MTTSSSPKIDPGQADYSRRRWLMSFIAIVWLIGTGAIIYQLESARVQLFDPSILEDQAYPLDTVRAGLRASLPQTNNRFIVHAWDDRCDCAELAINHLVSMRDQIEDAEAKVVFLVQPQDRQHGEAAAQAFAANSGIDVAGVIVDHDENWVPSSPAAIVVGEQGELIYLGPYASGSDCAATPGGFVETSLRLTGIEAQKTWINRAVVGCYCDWHSNTESTACMSVPSHNVPTPDSFARMPPQTQRERSAPMRWL